MLKFAKIINEDTKQCDVGTGTNIEFYQSLGMTEMDVEQAYDGCWYVKGYIPEKPQELKEKEVRQVRASYFDKYVDFYQSKPLMWEELDTQTKLSIAGYRKYLKDYTLEPNWYEHNPMTYEEWLEMYRSFE